MSEEIAQPTLLFVDDEPGILSALRRLFRPHGYRIFVAEGGAAGLEVLAKEEIDLVISDMRMPEMDGATFLKEVRSRWPNVMRILLTGYADITSTVASIRVRFIATFPSLGTTTKLSPLLPKRSSTRISSGKTCA